MHNKVFIILTILNVQFCGIRYIHIVEQASRPTLIIQQ